MTVASYYTIYVVFRRVGTIYLLTYWYSNHLEKIVYNLRSPDVQRIRQHKIRASICL